ncbi:MAG: cytochrome P450 [Anaerolineae bacterium]
MPKIPPGPAGNFYSQLQDLRSDFLAYLLNSAREHGDLVRLNPGPGTYLYLVNHPDLVREILVTKANHYHKSAMTQKMVGRFLGRGLIINEGKSHRQQRKLAQPAFHKKRVDAYAHAMVDLTQKEMATWRPKEGIKTETFDFEASMIRLTMKIVAKTLFGVDVGEESTQIGRIMELFAEAIGGQFKALPLPQWLPIPRHLRQKAAVAEMNTLIEQMVAAWRKDGVDNGDLMSMLLLARDEETGQGMSDKQLRDELVSIYFAGHETVAKLISWIVYQLTQYPAVAERVHAEIKANLGQEPIGPQDLAQLPYLDQVVKETLRLYPSAWVYDRTPLQDVELGGFHVPAGATIYVSPYVSQRDGRFFDRPDEFLPERFEPGWEQALPRYAYYPFGGGPRICIGQAFAEMEAKLILATILSEFSFELATTDPIIPEPGATLRPKDGLPVRATLIS